MKKFYFILTAAASVALASCTNDELVGNSPGTEKELNEAIAFGFNLQNLSRAGEFTGATAADKLGGMFVVEGTKGSEGETSPSTTVVFDNYLVGYDYNSAGTTESNTNNWEYVGKEAGITGRMTGLPTENSTWAALHPSITAQTVKYWDYSTSQYDFIAWSTGQRLAVTTTPTSGTSVQVTRINTGTLSSSAFQMTALSANDLLQCYYTDITKVLKANYGAPVTLTFRNMAAKVRIALYETVPGYSVQDVEFYQDESTALGTDISSNEATLYTPTGAANQLPQSGTVTVFYPRTGSNNSSAADYNKASVTVSAGSTTSPTQTFGTLSGTIGTSLPSATFAGSAADSYYKAVIPNTNGKPLTLRVNYTLVSTDGSNESIKVYGAKAVVPASYTNWLPNYAYTYIFKISDNTNGWTDTGATAQGLLPITFDAVVTSFVDANAEQTTVTTVATPSITTYQQGHNTGNNGAYTVPDEYDNDGAKLYVKVMNDGTPVTSLDENNSLFFAVSRAASEAEVMDALQNRTNDKDATSPVGRNGITLTAQTNGVGNVINNGATSIVNGVDNQPITVSAGEVAEIDLSTLAAGTYAYVYVQTAPSADEKIYNVVADGTATSTPTLFYEIKLTGTETPLTSGTAAANKVYFVKNVDAEGHFVSYTFKQTKVGDPVTDLVEATIDPATKATEHHTTSAGNYYFYFDVYNQNDGAYAVKVIKVVD